ncbi:MAG: c-type cytochrome [Pikeienuella sp.]
MLKFPKVILAGFLASATVTAAQADRLGLGRAATPEEVAAWDIDVRPDGLGLPEGSGDAITGEEVFIEKCAVCHGDFAEGVGRWPVLAGGEGTLASEDPVKTVGSYWPYLSTAWDYVNRAMPFGEAQSLTNDEVYAIVAYILYSNDLVEDDFVLSRESFLEVEMPNADGFFPDDRTESPLWGPREVCMENCKSEVKITKRAAVLDVTPETEGEGEAAAAMPAHSAAPEEPVVVAVAAPVIDEALAAKGEKVFKKCKACHKVGEGAKNKTGPQLNAIIGAPIGAVDGYKYSKAFKALRAEGAVWDMEALQGFLTKPKKWAKGTKMSFGGLKKEQDRLAVIEYLKTFSN